MTAEDDLFQTRKRRRKSELWASFFLVIIAVLASRGAYEYFGAGLHTRPPMPEGAFSISFKSGLRAVVVDVPDVRPERKYLGAPFDVPTWYEDSWSFCAAPTPDELAEAENQDLDPGMRLEAMCKIDLGDGEQIVRGALLSIPDV